jgi:hypothetical protein
MFHPLIKLLAAKPHLLAHHAAGYANLAALQAGEAVAVLRQRAVLAAAAGAALLLGTGLAGVALLLLAVVPVADMPAPWLLAAAPALPLLAAAALLWQLRQRPWAWSMAPLRAQWEADARLLDEVAG